MAEENIHFSAFIATVIVFLCCLCIIGCCVIRQKRKFKKIEQQKQVQRQILFNYSKSYRPQHVVSVSPHTSIVIDDCVATLQSSNRLSPSTPISPNQKQYAHRKLHIL